MEMSADMFEMSREGMLLPKMYISTTEKTFQYDNDLPPLPVPSLKHTLTKYLKSVRPHLTDEEYQETENIVQRFEAGAGKELHGKLLDSAKYKKNWVEKFWEDYAYLSNREPHSPYVNFSGGAPYTNVWPPKEGTQVERAAMGMWCTLKYWENLRRERVTVDRGGMKAKKVWSMSQFRRMFNSCKTPGKTIDKLNFHFKTVSEGDADDRVLVLHKGRFFNVHGTDRHGAVLTAPELQVQLQYIVDTCRDVPWGPGVGALTSHRRPVWYEAREHMIALHPRNKQILDIIERCAFITTLDEYSPTSPSDTSHESLTGDPRNRWLDKAISQVMYKQGTAGCNCDHAPHDAMIMVSNTLWNYLILTQCGGQWQGTKEVRSFAPPVELEFVLDSKLHVAIEEAKLVAKQGAEAIEVLTVSYKGYGRKLMRKFKIYPDTYVQMAIQYAYYRLYNKPAPTYETASTRQFYNARTETLRSCSVESTAFSKAMMDANVGKEEKARLFKLACDQHNQEMVECQDAMGCDRHLFGLQCIARESEMQLPDIFTHPSWTKSGGDGNFVLSTSFVGYTPVYGGVAPMCKNGYGSFYSIENNHINFYISTWTADVVTNAQMYFDSLTKSLDNIRDLLTAMADQSKL